MTKSNLQWALDYIERGYAIFPAHTITNGKCSCDKLECNSPGKHPRTRQGVNDATTDEEKIRAWWKANPNSNIAIATGLISGFFVLDIDSHHDGLASLATLQQENGTLPDTVVADTGGGGKHYFFKCNDLLIANSIGKIASGIDIRGEGGYIIACPSNHKSGKSYAWQSNKALGEVEIAPPPEWLKNMVLTKNEHQERQNRSSIPQGIPINEGSRNFTLASEAGKLQRVATDSTTILHMISKLNIDKCSPPLSDNEVRAIVNSITKYSPTFPCTDAGNAERLVHYHGNDLRYCAVHKKWYFWNGILWEKDNTQKIDQYAIMAVRNIGAEARSAIDDLQRQNLLKWALASKSKMKVKALIELAQSNPKIAVLPNQFDSSHWLLNVKNGTIDLKTGNMREHCRNDLITQLAPVNYEPAATCPTWKSTLLKCMNKQVDMSTYLQSIFGYTLTGETTEQCIYIAYGNGANGKSTIINTVLTILGDYATQTPTETLMVSNKGIPNDIARLQGTRMVVASEGEDGQRLAEGLIKQLSGGDRVSARFLYGEFFEFIPNFKVFLVTNHKPTIKGTDHGIWRRIKLIPFEVIIPQEERDSSLPAKLLEETSGILNWLIEGCLKWQRGAILVPNTIKKAISAYIKECDPVAYFLEECCIMDENSKVAMLELYEKYKAWCDERGERPPTYRRFNQRIKERDFEDRRSGLSGDTEWHGLSLSPIFPSGGFTLPLQSLDEDVEDIVVN